MVTSPVARLLRLLAEQGGLLFQDGDGSGEAGVGDVGQPEIVGVRHGTSQKPVSSFEFQEPVSNF